MEITKQNCRGSAIAAYRIYGPIRKTPKGSPGSRTDTVLLRSQTPRILRENDR